MNINGIYTNGSSNGSQNAATTVLQETEILNTENKSSGEAVKVSSAVPGIEDTNVIYGQNELKAENDTKEAEASDKEEKLEDKAEQLTEKDYQAILDEGMSLEKYNLEQLDRMLERVKSQRKSNEEGVKETKEAFKEKTEALTKINNIKGLNKRIVQKLQEANLPVTEDNILKIAGSLSMAQSAIQLTDQAISYLVKNNLEPTIENLYKAKFSTAGMIGKAGQSSYKSGQTAYSVSGVSPSNSKLSEEEWKGLQGQLTAIFDNAGIKKDASSLEMAKWLINHNMPVNSNSLWSYLDIKQLTAEVTEEEILNKSIESLTQGKAPETASLSQKAGIMVNDLINTIDTITDKAIEEVVQTRQENTNQQVSIKDLSKAQQELKKTATKKDDEARSFVKTIGDSLDIKTITVRRQLEEIRLKMTAEAGGKLLKKGFKFDTDSLSKIVDGLREIEDTYYKNLLREGNVEADSINTKLIKTSLAGIEELKSMPSYILGSTLQTRKTETVTSLLTKGNDSKNIQANQAYETLMTKPRADMGDSIQKAFRNVDDILKSLNLETTQANQRAVRILGYNGISIDEENIKAVKEYDTKVNYLMKNFHPAVAVELIREGTNPLNMPIEELNQQIDITKDRLGVGEEEKYSRYLWKLEKNNEISEEEKTSFIGIYRLLNTIEKSDGAAVGAVMQSGQNLTMKSLLTAIRSKKALGVDTSIDDSFGVLEKLTLKNNSITDQINTSYLAEPLEDKTNYLDYLVKDIMDNITPDNLKAAGNAEEIMDMSIEKLHEEITQNKELSTSDLAYIKSKTEEFKELLLDSGEALNLLKHYNLPVTAQNITAAGELQKGKNAFVQMKELAREGITKSDEDTKAAETTGSTFDINEISDSLLEALKDPQSIKNRYQDIEQDMKEMLNTFYSSPTITSFDVTTMQRIRYGMSFLSKMSSKENYEIPLAVGDNITNVNVTVLRNTNETGKVNINMDSEILGTIGVSLSVKNNGLNALITCDSRLTLDMLQGQKESLTETILAQEVKINQINYSIGNIKADSYRYNNQSSYVGETGENSDSKDKVNTNTLYSLAKTFLIHMKEIELEGSL